MTRDDISTHVHTVLSNRRPERTREIEITDKTRIVCLGMDSLSLLEATVDIEDFCDLEVPDGDLVEVVTVADLIGYLARRVGLAEAA